MYYGCWGVLDRLQDRNVIQRKSLNVFKCHYLSKVHQKYAHGVFIRLSQNMLSDLILVNI